MSELKPCPFCGGNAKLNLLRKNNSDGHIKHQFYIKCSKCEICTPIYESDIYQDEKGLLHIDKDGACQAFDMWNCRCDTMERSCSTCAKDADNGGVHEDGRTKCPIQEHYALLKDGFCHLYSPAKMDESEEKDEEKSNACF